MDNIQDLENWLQRIKDPNYNGIPHDFPITKEFKSNEYTGTKYSWFNAFKDKNGNLLKNPSPNSWEDPIYGSLKYIYEAGYSNKDIEGGSIDEHLKYHETVIKRFINENGREPKWVAEIGFNTGVSASFYLSKDYNVISFDLGAHSYCFYAKLWIDKKYPNQHTLINGSSFSTIPTFSKFAQSMKFDIIFIDGDHTAFGAYWDIINCRDISHENTLVILDNFVPHRGVGEGVYRAALRAYDDGDIDIIEMKEIFQYDEEYHDGSALVKYRFDKSIPQTPFNYLEAEKKILSYSIYKILLPFKNKRKFSEEEKKLINHINNIMISNLDNVSEFTQNFVGKIIMRII